MGLAWEDFPDEELRIAGVFNGGVSLAVWMGGATHEVNRLIHARHRNAAGDAQTDPGADPGYRALLELVHTTVVADVLAGTSAGGINGAALAVAQANVKADLAMLRNVWAEQGRFDELLRAPFQGDPTSLLRGDEFFLPQLNRAMTELATVGVEPDAAPVAEGPDIDLIITTTLLKPAEREVPDDLGQATYQQVHAGQFQFSQQHFAPESLPTTAGKLGLAARASAGFPVAFEPTFIPVNAPADRPDRDLRPDMAGHASWESGTDDRSRFAIDGGVLANTPLRNALDAIRDKTARDPVRRLMLLVYPHAPLTSTTVKVAQDEPPTVVATVLDLVAALRSHGGQTFIEELETHNRAVEGWRGGRDDALPGPGRLETLYNVVDVAWPRYRDLRERLSAATLADRVKRRAWTYERTRVAALGAQHEPQLPYVPEVHPPELASLGLTDTPDLGAAGGPLQEWRWGPVVAIGITDSLEAIIRSASGIADAAERLAPLNAARATVTDARAEIVTARREVDEIWDDPQAVAMSPDVGYWKARLVAFRRAMLRPPEVEDLRDLAILAELGKRAPEVRDRILALHGDQGLRIGRAVWAAVSALADPGLSTLLREMSHTDAARLTGLDRWQEVLERPALATEPQDPVLRLLVRLLAVDTATWLIASSDSQGTHLPIKSAQLSLGVQHGFARLSTAPADKAAGLQLGHFAGFLKRSWRANDWIWGRLDAARLLCEVVLSPERLRRLALASSPNPEPEALAEQVLAVLTPALGAPSDELRARLRKELVPVFVERANLPPRLPILAEYAALPIQRRIIIEELPHLRSAILADRFEKQNPRSRGELFLVEHASLLASVEADPDPETLGDRALAAFDSAGIGREGLQGEAGSDAMISTAANVAGVAATVLSSDRFGAKAVQPIAKVVRGAIQLPYWALRGLTQGTAIARILAQIALVVGGVLLTLGLLGVLGGGSGFATAIGVATVLTVLGYSALRTGTLLHGVLLLAAAGPLGAFLVSSASRTEDGSAADIHDGLVGAVVVLSICAALWILASLPWPMQSPVVTTQRLWARWADPIVVTLVSVELLGSLVALVIIESDWSFDDVRSSIQDAVPSPVAATATAVAAVVLGSFIAWMRGRGLRTWRPGTAGRRTTRQNLHLPAGVAATWAVVYGAVCLAAAGAVAWWGAEGTPWTFSVAWLAVLGVLLTLVAPAWLTYRFRRRLNNELAAISPVPTNQRGFIEELGKRDRLFVYLVRPATEAEEKQEPGDLRLTRRGQRVHTRALDNAGIRPVWDRA